MREILRRCIACKKIGKKEDFLRIVRTKEGNIFIDLDNKIFGRSAYICRDKNCIKIAFSKKRLEKALRVDKIDQLYKTKMKENLLEYIKEVKNEKIQSV